MDARLPTSTGTRSLRSHINSRFTQVGQRTLFGLKRMPHIGKLLYNCQNNCQLYEIVVGNSWPIQGSFTRAKPLLEINVSDSCNIIPITTDTKWVIKIKQDHGNGYDEIEKLKQISSVSIRNSVKFPSMSKNNWCGLLRDKKWCIMKRYVRPVDEHKDCSNWKKIAIACLQFASDLHRKTNMIYYDWKVDNILIDKDGSYVISDYEWLTGVGEYEPYLHKMERNLKYHLISLGAEESQPTNSYRMDLSSIGWLIYSLYRNSVVRDKPSLTTDRQTTCSSLIYKYHIYWRNICDLLRERKKGVSCSDEILYEFRQIDLNNCENEIINAYFEKIKECSWKKKNQPMSEKWYNDLISIFE